MCSAYSELAATSFELMGSKVSDFFKSPRALGSSVANPKLAK